MMNTNTNTTEMLLSANTSRLEDLFNAAHKNPELKLQLLTHPAEVAEQWGIKLEEQDAERLTKLGIFAELAREARVGSLFRAGDPRVWYASQFWLQQEVIELLRELIHPIELPIAVVQGKLDRTLYLGNNPGNQGRGINLSRMQDENSR